MKNNILSVDWAFHKTGFAYYDCETKICYTWTYEIPDKVKINWWNEDFYWKYKSKMLRHLFNFKLVNGYSLVSNNYLVEVGFGKVDKMSLFYAWFYHMWLNDGWKVEFINSKDWIIKTLNVNHPNNKNDAQPPFL